MYKKRINAWGLSKHIKADEKETAITKLLHDESLSTTSGSAPIRHDKLVRYAKSRARSGALDARCLSTIVDRTHGQPSVHRQRNPQFYPMRHVFMHGRRHPTIKTGFIPRSPTPPIDHANFDLFLRAMTVLIERERYEWLTGQQDSPSQIFDALTTGLTRWRSNAFTEARQSFNQAAQTMTKDLQGVVAISRISFCISSVVWGAAREPVFLQFVRFMGNAALENLGPNHALTIVLDQLSGMWSLDAQVVIWACAVENYRVSEENVHHWWNMVRRRWRWCRGSGLMDLAVRYRDHAVDEARRMNKLTGDMEREAQLDLEVASPGEAEESPHAIA